MPGRAVAVKLDVGFVIMARVWWFRWGLGDVHVVSALLAGTVGALICGALARKYGDVFWRHLPEWLLIGSIILLVVVFVVFLVMA